MLTEVRQKGVGFFSFSTNEEERQEQMRQLKQMREETLDKRKGKERLKELRKEKYQGRLRALQEKRAKKLGLPLPSAASNPGEGDAGAEQDDEEEEEEDHDDRQTKPLPPQATTLAQDKASRFLQKLGQELGLQ